ncbi:hypothetical protein LTR85_009128 [Meristemomyces frigidus]|nr:hypothetical protein LTR85_009128 [Meristemomyces frigidus]
MPSKIQDEDIEVDEAPTTINPYAVLALDENATQDQIKTAYRKAALKHHPDKAAPDDKEAAHTRFQEVAFAYAILSDEKRRRRYDSTGNTSESLDLEDDDFDWTTFFREQFKNVVTEDTINDFAQTYKGSDEERGHILAAYEKHAGNMDKLYQDVMLSDVLEDDDRFRAIIDKAIEDEEVEAHKKYTHESEKSRKARITTARKRKEKEAKEAEKAAKELEEDPKSKKSSSKAGKKGNDGDMSDLAALIQQRQKGRAEGFFDHLEAKYAAPPPAKGKKGSKRPAPASADADEPSEEAFAKNRKASKTEGEEADATEGARRSKRSKKA